MAAKETIVDDLVAVLSELGSIFLFKHKKALKASLGRLFFGGEAMLLLHSNYLDWSSWK